MEKLKNTRTMESPVGTANPPVCQWICVDPALDYQESYLLSQGLLRQFAAIRGSGFGFYVRKSKVKLSAVSQHGKEPIVARPRTDCIRMQILCVRRLRRMS
jgi:hypothetical protein